MRLLTHGCVSHLPTDGSLPMTDENNAAIDAIQIDEDVLSYTASDEALEAAAASREARASYYPPQTQPCLLQCLVWRD